MIMNKLVLCQDWCSIDTEKSFFFFLIKFHSPFNKFPSLLFPKFLLVCFPNKQHKHHVISSFIQTKRNNVCMMCFAFAFEDDDDESACNLRNFHFFTYHIFTRAVHIAIVLSMLLQLSPFSQRIHMRTSNGVANKKNNIFSSICTNVS